MREEWWTREEAEVALRYMEQHAMVEPNTMFLVSGLRIYEKSEERPRHVIANIYEGGWIGFLDAAKAVNVGKEN